MLVILVGPSGSGKTFTERGLYASGFTPIRSTTSRKMQERDGVDDYEFITKETFRFFIHGDEFIEYALFNGNYYGVRKGAIKPEMNQVVTLEPTGAKAMKEYCEGAGIECKVIWFKVDRATRGNLMKSQGRSDSEIQKRLNDGIDERYNKGFTPHLTLTKAGDYEAILSYLNAS